MRRAFTIRPAAALGALLCAAWPSLALRGQSAPQTAPQTAPQSPTQSPTLSTVSAGVVIDRVIAVVNNRPVLLSDIENELRLSVLEAETAGDKPDARAALQRLVSRALIQQQIRREEEQAAEPSVQQVQDRIAELRRQLPACVRADCASDSGWANFLAQNDLTQADVNAYMRMRLEILKFIEDRFQQGIRITEEEIEDYYNKTLLPQYPAGQSPPALESVSHRIEEILLQEKVNALFSAWLDNLRRQGDVEVLDPALESPFTLHTNEGGDR